MEGEGVPTAGAVEECRAHPAGHTHRLATEGVCMTLLQSVE